MANLKYGMLIRVPSSRNNSRNFKLVNYGCFCLDMVIFKVAFRDVICPLMWLPYDKNRIRIGAFDTRAAKRRNKRKAKEKKSIQQSS